ncbi:MAG: hypothetical protein WCO57_12820 [Verrucomicrobiota bacterium]
MIVRFHSYEEAAIYAGVMQADGHFAAILDESMGFMYGPLAIGGFRVIVTREPVLETEEPPADGPIEAAVLNFLRLLVGAFVVCGLAVGIGLLWTEAGDMFVTGVLVQAAAVTGWLGMYMILGPLMIPFTRALRNKASAFGGLVKGLVACLFVGQLAFAFVCFVRVLWLTLVG